MMNSKSRTVRNKNFIVRMCPLRLNQKIYTSKARVMSKNSLSQDKTLTKKQADNFGPL